MSSTTKVLLVLVPLLALGLLVWGMGWALGMRQRAAPLPVLAALPPLAAEAADRAPVDLAQLRGHVWVASVLEGEAPEPGAPVLRTLRELQNTFKKTGTQVLLVTLCPDATPAALQRLREHAGLPAERWLALGGPGVAGFLRGGFAAPLGLAAPGWAALGQRLFLVDRQGRLRAVQDALDPGGLAFVKSHVGNLLREVPGGT